jgi:DNA invertase Pin-like site-specific DNA recombinase
MASTSGSRIPTASAPAEAIDTTTPYGKLVFTILGAVAELERSLIAERIKNGMKKSGAKKPGPKIGPPGPSRSTLYRPRVHLCEVSKRRFDRLRKG